MRNLLFLFVIACGGSSPPPPAPPVVQTHETPPPAVQEDPVDVVAMRFATAALHGDADEVNRIALTFDEIAELSTRAADREDWNKMIEHVRKRFAEVGARDHLEVQRAEIVKHQTVTPDHDKVRRAIEAAVVRVYLVAPDGSTREEHFVFVHTTAGWRYSPKA